MIETKVCAKCQQEKLKTEFYRHKRDKFQTWCKSCKREYKREYLKRPEAKEAQKKTYARLTREGYFRNYYRQSFVNRFKRLARNYASNAFKRGWIEQQPCAFCGREDSQMHHPEYEQRLLIVWLCIDCHRELHHQLREGEGTTE